MSGLEFYSEWPVARGPDRDRIGGKRRGVMTLVNLGISKFGLQTNFS